MTMKGTTRGTFRVDFVKKWRDFPQIIHKIVPYARDFLPTVEVFDLKHKRNQL